MDAFYIRDYDVAGLRLRFLIESLFTSSIHETGKSLTRTSNLHFVNRVECFLRMQSLCDVRHGDVSRRKRTISPDQRTT